VVGTAAPDPNDETIPCCAIVAVDKHVLSDIGTGLSTLAIHEMGHVLGLRHPHDGHDHVKGEFNNWFFDWSYSPMSYAAPNGLGCGIPNEPCGLVVSEFGQFDHDAMDRAIILSLLNQMQHNVYNSTILLEGKGYRNSNLPDGVKSKFSGIDLNVKESIENFIDMNYFNHTTFESTANIMDPMDDAFDYALKALTDSEILLEEASRLIDTSPTNGERSIVSSEPFFVDESDNQLISVKVGEKVGIKTEMTSNLEEDVTFTYLIQIKDSNDFTLYLRWLEGISVKPDEVVEPSIFWSPDIVGELQIEVFAWQNIGTPAPLAPVKSTTITVTE
ncbi:MAG: hypothetical protein ACRD38_08320, partial [Nitrososphaerales archaeon]